MADKNLKISIIYTPLKSCQDYNMFIVNMLKYIDNMILFLPYMNKDI